MAGREASDTREARAGGGARIEALEAENAALRAALAREVELREEMLSLAAHDLRSPASAVILGLQRLARMVDAASRPRALPLLDRLEQALRAADRRLGGLHELARIDAGRLTLRRRPEAPLPVAARALEPLAPLAAERAQRLALRVPAELRPVDWDPERIALALSSLATNALQASPEGAAVEVVARDEGDGVRFSVCDQGPGLDPAVLEAAGDRRAPLPAGRRRGIGLALACGLADAHGGRLWAERAPAGGTAVHLWIPRVSPGREDPSF